MINYSTRNWLSLVFRLQGTVIRRVAGRTFACAFMAAVTVVLHDRGLDITIPVVVHSIIGVALGLLLVFRTNSSYDRYWEGRKTVGDMVAHCRDLARQTTGYLGTNDECAKMCGRYIVAFYTTVRRQLRQEHHHPELLNLLGEERVKELDESEEPPLTVATWLTALYVSAAADGRLTEVRLRTLDTNIGGLVRAWSDAERIHKTPVPFAYAHHIKVFLTLFCFTVPFAIAHVAHWYAIAGSTIVAFGLFGIDEIGVEIEDPFGYDENDLPLDEIGSQLEVDISSITSPPES